MVDRRWIGIGVLGAIAASFVVALALRPDADVTRGVSTRAAMRERADASLDASTPEPRRIEVAPETYASDAGPPEPSIAADPLSLLRPETIALLDSVDARYEYVRTVLLLRESPTAPTAERVAAILWDTKSRFLQASRSTDVSSIEGASARENALLAIRQLRTAYWTERLRMLEPFFGADDMPRVRLMLYGE